MAIKVNKVYTKKYELISTTKLTKKDSERFSEFKLIKGTTFDGAPVIKILASLRGSNDYAYLKASPSLQDESFVGRVIDPSTIKVYSYKYLPTGRIFQVIDGDLM